LPGENIADFVKRMNEKQEKEDDENE